MILLNLDPSNAVVTGYGPNDTVICLCDATIGAFEISLPEADGVENVTFIFIRKDTTENAITIKGRNGQNINGAESIELNEHAIVIPANNSYYDLSTFSSFRTSSLLIKEGIEEPPIPPDGYIRLYSDRAHGNDLFFKFDDGSIYHLNFDPNDYALVGHTHDALYAALSDVAWLSVAESESAAIGTLGGNLALGANYLNYDGAADKGIVFASSNQLIIKNTDGIALGDAKQMVSIRENTGNGNTGNGAGISLHGNDGLSATKLFGGIKAYKENSITGDHNASVYIQTRANGQAPANALRLDSDQNGYITNKLMVGSLTETPESQLSVFKDANESVFLSVGNSNTGQNGVRIGLDQVLENSILTEHVVFDMQYTTRAITFRSEGPVAGVYEPLMSLYWGPDEEKLVDIRGSLHVAGSSSLANVEAEDVSVDNLEVDDTLTAKLIKADWFDGHLPLYIKNATDAVYIECNTIEDVKTVTIADKLVVDGNLQVDNDITLGGVFDADDKITALAINAKYLGSTNYILYIKSNTGDIAAFQEYDELRSLRVYGNLVVDGLTASQIVETDANKKLISVAKGTAYNANFGTGSNNVCQGNDSRLSDARTPINNDYYVQGNASTRTTDTGFTDVNSYSKSGFYRAASASPHAPTVAGSYGIIHTNFINNQYAFQLASRWDSNNLFYRVKNSSTWEPWVELYHTGNFDPSTKQPADATLTALAGLNTTKGFLYQTGTDAFTKYPFGTTANTVCEGDDSRLSDSREPINHGSHTSSYYVQGTTNRRSYNYDSASPIDERFYSTFFRLDKTDPSGPNDGINYYGLRAVHPSDNTYTTEIIGRIGQNRLLWGGWDGTRRAWLEIYHSGNFTPADYALVGHTHDTLSVVKSGASQAAAGAVAGEVWKTNGHTTLPDNILMIGV